MRSSIRKRSTVAFIGLAVGPLLLVGVILAWRSFATEQEPALNTVLITLAPVVAMLVLSGTLGFGVVRRLEQQVAERERAEESLRRTNETLAGLAEFPAENPNPVLRIMRDGLINYANPASAAVLDAWGCQAGECVPDEWRELVQATLDSGSSRRVETSVQERTFSWTLAPVVDADHANLYGLDITERKQMEAALRESEERYRQLFELESDVIFLIDNETGRILEANSAASEVYGYSREELLTKKNTDLSAEPEDTQRVTRTTPPVLDQVVNIPLRFHRRKDGTVFPVEITGRFFLWRGRSVHIAAIRDITERRRAGKALQMFQLCIEQAADAVFWLDQEGRYTYVNEEACRSLGYTRDELMHMHLWDVDPVFPRERYAEEWAQFQKGELGTQLIETRHRRKDGVIFPVEVSYWQIWLGDTELHVAYVRDITERKRAEAELAAKREAERQFSEQLATLVAVTNELSKAQTLDELCRRAVEAGRNRLGFDRLALWFVTEDGTTMLGTYGTSVDGQTTDERHTRHAIDHLSRLRPIVEGRVALQSYEDAPLYQADGKQVGWGRRVAAGLWDGETVIGFLSIDNFIRQQPFTDHDRELMRLYASALGHLCTLKRAQEKLVQLAEALDQRVTERTAELEAANQELEAFAYSVSHDLRAPLRAIDGFTRILVEDYEPSLGAEGKRVCAVVRDEARRMAELIDDLLAFSRLSRAEMQASPIDMESLAISVFYESMMPESRERIDFHVDALPPAVGDPILIRQVWMNLLANAVKFSSSRERATIEVGSRQDAGETIYWVQDNGAGFDMQYAHKLFGVFQRLHSEREFEGTGVGLAIVQRIIHRHGGRVWAEGAVDRGATFYFALPRNGD
ncbi:MAG TPA: PAS domain S-box protein [Anaerolineae bacterium]